MIKQIYKTIKDFPGNKRLFIISCITNLPRILRDKTILTMKFITPIKIKTKYGEKLVKHYYEIPFYTYDYSNILAEIGNNTVLFDIGAHFGEVTYRFLKEKIGGCSLMFEINPHNCSIINELLTGVQNALLFKHGLSDRNNKVHIYLNNPLSYEGTLQKVAGDELESEVKSLDSIFAKNMNWAEPNLFFKIDVEGHELEVINGMLKTLKRNRKKNIKLLIEIKDNSNVSKIYQILKKVFKSVKVIQISNEDYLFIKK